MAGTTKFEVKDIAGYEDTKLVRIIGDLDANSADSLRKTVEPHIDKGRTNLLVDFNELRFIDSIGNLYLIRLYLKLKKYGGSIKFFKVSKNISEILELMGISKLIDIYPSYEEALESFNR